MKISICVPQYNRIAFLMKSLELISQQQYPHIEIVISDDGSTDNTEQEIKALIPKYKYPITYHRNVVNLGYDRNFRQSVELATGEYIVLIGNDDTINPATDIGLLVDFLTQNNFPEVGFCNFIEESSGNTFTERAKKTTVLGTGYEVAMQHYSCFSFVGGLIYKRDAFLKYNTSKHDGSVYAQIYLGCYMVAAGCRLFSIHEPLVIKDIVVGTVDRDSYRDTLTRKWKDYKKQDGGLPSVINVLLDSFRDAGVLKQGLIYSVFKRIYTVTYPFWIVDYKSNKALPAAVGLMHGLVPWRNNNFKLLSAYNRARIAGYYMLFSAGGLVMPVSLFNKMKGYLYKKFKRS